MKRACCCESPDLFDPGVFQTGKSEQVPQPVLQTPWALSFCRTDGIRSERPPSGEDSQSGEFEKTNPAGLLITSLMNNCLCDAVMNNCL